MEKFIISSEHRIIARQLEKYIQVSKNTTRFHAQPDTIVIHYTAGSSASSSATWLADPKVKASAHVVIGQEGEIYQLVPFDTIAWHAGASAYAGRTAFNNFSIGIELDNPGFLAPFGEEYVSAFGKRYPRENVIKAVHRNEKTARFWHTFTESQMESCYNLCQALIEKYPIRKILGHEEISPGIKLDPGPAFPLDNFRQRLLSNSLPS